MPTPRVPAGTSGPGSVSLFCHWPISLCSPAASPLAVHRHTSTSMCLWQDPIAMVVNADGWDSHSRQCTHSILWPLLPTLAPTTICVIATSLCHSLYKHLQLAPASECLYTSGSSHYCYLPWSLAAEDPNSSYSICGPPAVPTKDHTVFDAADRSDLSWQGTVLPWTQCHHMPLPHPQVNIFP